MYAPTYVSKPGHFLYKEPVPKESALSRMGGEKVLGEALTLNLSGTPACPSPMIYTQGL